MRIELRKHVEDKIGVAVQRFVDELVANPAWGDSGEHLRLTIECWVNTDEPAKPWDAPPDPDGQGNTVGILITTERKSAW